MKKVLSILAVCLVAMMVVALTGCDKKTDADPTAATVATETAIAATAAETAYAEQKQTEATAQPGADDAPQSEVATEGEDGYIDEAAAIDKVREQAGADAQIISSYKGYSPEGYEAWVITVQPVTTADGPELVTYFSGYLFCYPDTSGNYAVENVADPNGYIDKNAAIENVRNQVGSGAEIISCEAGYSPDGIPAWVIVVAPVTTADGPETVTYYSGYLFCYPETDNE